MKISDILRRKGADVATVDGNTPIKTVLAVLASHDVGALVVVDGAGIIGIISERDIVRNLNSRGPGLLDAPAAEIMTRAIATSSPEDTVDEAMRTMTDQRVRHLPVVAAGGMVGIVSIGDVVKSRIDELKATTDQLEQYISGG